MNRSLDQKQIERFLVASEIISEDMEDIHRLCREVLEWRARGVALCELNGSCIRPIGHDRLCESRSGRRLRTKYIEVKS